jgi:hypothetical protein
MSLITYNFTAQEKQDYINGLYVDLSGKAVFNTINDDGLIIDIFNKDNACNYTIEENCNGNTHNDETGYANCQPGYYEIVITESCSTSSGTNDDNNSGVDSDTNNSTGTTTNDDGYTPHPGGSGGGTTTPVLCEDCPEFQDDSENLLICEKLKTIATTTDILTKFSTLKTHSNDTSPAGKREKAFKIRQHNLTNELSSPGIVTATNDNFDGETYSVSVTPTLYMTAYVHTHPNTGSIKMFSPQDILYLARMANVIDNSINPVDLTAFLIVNGETYAIRFDDLATVQALQAIYNDTDKQLKFIKKLTRDYNKDNNPFTGATSDLSDQRQRILTFLSNQNLNISLYKADDTNDFLTTWEKYNDDGTKAPCN